MHGYSDSRMDFDRMSIPGLLDFEYRELSGTEITFFGNFVRFKSGRGSLVMKLGRKHEAENGNKSNFRSTERYVNRKERQKRWK